MVVPVLGATLCVLLALVALVHSGCDGGARLSVEHLTMRVSRDPRVLRVAMAAADSILPNKSLSPRHVAIKSASETHDAIITDVFTYRHGLRNDYKIMAMFGRQKHAIFVAPMEDDNAASSPTLSQLDARTSIGFLNPGDDVLIRLLLNSMKSRAQTYPVLKRVAETRAAPILRHPSKSLFEANAIDMLFVFSTNFRFDSRSFQPRAVRFNEDIDYHKLAAVLPGARVRLIDDDLGYALFFDMIMCGTRSFEMTLDASTKLQAALSHILRENTNADVLNYYSIRYDMFAATARYMQKFNTKIRARASNRLQILEEFGDEKKEEEEEGGVPTIVANRSVAGFYESAQETLSVLDPAAAALALGGLAPNASVVGWIVNLGHQAREEENGVYRVEHVDPGTSEPGRRLMRLRKLAGSPGSRTGEAGGGGEDNPLEDPRYDCYGRPEIKSMAECLHKRLVWDRRCSANAECPFYQKNANYPNYGGGCIDGMCQAPLGVARTSYRTFDPDSKPYCHGCPASDPACCDSQRPRPDYMFALDEFDRRLHAAAAAKEAFSAPSSAFFPPSPRPSGSAADLIDLAIPHQVYDSVKTEAEWSYLREEPLEVLEAKVLAPNVGRTSFSAPGFQVYARGDVRILYRFPKMYGVMVTLRTDADGVIAGYAVNGYVFADKVNDVLKKNIVPHARNGTPHPHPAAAGREHGQKVLASADERAAVLRRHFDLLRKDRGLTPDSFA